MEGAFEIFQSSVFNFPADAILGVEKDNMHFLELVADRVGGRPVLVGSGFAALCDQRFDFRAESVAARRLLLGKLLNQLSSASLNAAISASALSCSTPPSVPRDAMRLISLS